MRRVVFFIEGALLGTPIGLLIATAWMASFGHYLGGSWDTIWAFTIWIAVGIGVIYFWFRYRKNGGAKALDKVYEFVWRPFDASEKVGYAEAEKELESGNVDRELWAKALANAGGDEAKRKAEYMHLRAKQSR